MDIWGNIPSVTLLEILRYLNRRDRLSCSVVCKTWYDTVCNPLLWKHMVVCMDTDLIDPVTEATINRYASHIKHLELTWSKPHVPRRWLRSRILALAQDICHFLMLLKECNISLSTFKLSNLCFTWKFKKVIFHLTAFLKQQRFLKFVMLSNTYLRKSDILKILYSFRNSNQTLKQLELLSSFYEWHNVFISAEYVNALRQFSNLEVFKTDYSSLSDKILMSLIENGNRRLKLIEINVKDTDNRSHVISSETWYKMAQQCKKLKVILRIQNICHYEDIYYILIDTMPLHIFVLQCAHVWDQSRSRNYCGTFNLLINFEVFLTHISLLLQNNREMVDYYLYEMIRKCKNLQFLEFDGVIRTANVLRDICILHCNNEHNFQFFHVRPRYTSFQNNLIISDIWRNYVQEIQDGDFHFEVETFNKSTVRIFC